MTTELQIWEPTIPEIYPNFVLVEPQRTVEDNMADEFPVFCRRVCGTCHAEAREILPSCPIVKFDAFLHLHRDHGLARIARLLRGEIEKSIDDKLIRMIANQAVVSKNINRTNDKGLQQ